MSHSTSTMWSSALNGPRDLGLLKKIATVLRSKKQIQFITQTGRFLLEHLQPRVVYLGYIISFKDYSLYSLFVAVVDFFEVCLTIHFIKKTKIIIYFVMICCNTK
jgi:hypothetical protein